jgi:hypothetical protein
MYRNWFAHMGIETRHIRCGLCCQVLKRRPVGPMSRCPKVLSNSIVKAMRARDSSDEKVGIEAPGAACLSRVREECVTSP